MFVWWYRTERRRRGIGGLRAKRLVYRMLDSERSTASLTLCAVESPPNRRITEILHVD